MATSHWKIIPPVTLPYSNVHEISMKGHMRVDGKCANQKVRNGDSRSLLRQSFWPWVNLWQFIFSPSFSVYSLKWNTAMIQMCLSYMKTFYGLTAAFGTWQVTFSIYRLANPYKQVLSLIDKQVSLLCNWCIFMWNRLFDWINVGWDWIYLLIGTL